MYRTKDEVDEEALMQKKLKKIVVWSLVGLFVLFSILMSVVIIPAGYVGVITRFKAVNRVAPAGLSLKIPWVEGATKMNIRTQKDQVEASAASFNLQDVNSIIAVNYHLEAKYATYVFANVGRNYQELVVAPAIQDAFKAVTARYTAEALIQRRDEVSNESEKELQAALDEYHIIVENFNVINFKFSEAYSQAIEDKQVAEQQVNTSRLLLQKAQVEAQTAVVQAQAQADAQKALKDTGAMSPEYLKYLFLTKWNGKLPEVMGGASGVFDVMQFVDTEPAQ